MKQFVLIFRIVSIIILVVYLLGFILGWKWTDEDYYFFLVVFLVFANFFIDKLFK